MYEILTEDTKVTLLLCGYFANNSQEKPLALQEYNSLARWLAGESKRPSSLLDRGVLDEAAACASIELPRLEGLLARGVQLGFAVEEWQRNGIWVISRSDADYPGRYKKHLKDKAPPLLFGAGDRSLLERSLSGRSLADLSSSGGALAIVGSRNVDAEGADFAHAVGTLCANADVAVVSGGARGVDQISTTACLDAGGVAVSVLAESLLKKSVERAARQALGEGRLLLLSPFHPTAPFSTAFAMARNKLIYALADYALVVSADFQKGGTWTGAKEELHRKPSTPVFVRTGDNVPNGNVELLKLGALAWPQSIKRENFSAALREASASCTTSCTISGTTSCAISGTISSAASITPAAPLSIAQIRLEAVTRHAGDPEADEPAPEKNDRGKNDRDENDRDAHDRDEHDRTDSPTGKPETGNAIYEAVLPILLECLKTPVAADALAETLQVHKTQLASWLDKAIAEDRVSRLSRPVRYVKKQQAQASLWSH